MKKVLFSLMTIAFLISCGPSVSPQLKAKVDGYANKSAAANFPATKKFTEAMPLAVGQYVVYIITDEDGKKSVTRMSIVGKEGDGWVYEYYSLTESQETVSQMLIAGFEKVRKSGNPDDIEIRWVKILDENKQVQKIEGPVLSIMKGMYKGNVANMTIKTTVQANGGIIKVPAGTFAGTVKIHTRQNIMGKEYESDCWMNSAVPLNGVVKSVTNKNEMVMELIKFGTRGAVALIK